MGYMLIAEIIALKNNHYVIFFQFKISFSCYIIDRKRNKTIIPVKGRELTGVPIRAGILDNP